MQVPCDSLQCTGNILPSKRSTFVNHVAIVPLNTDNADVDDSSSITWFNTKHRHSTFSRPLAPAVHLPATSKYRRAIRVVAVKLVAGTTCTNSMFYPTIDSSLYIGNLNLHLALTGIWKVWMKTHNSHRDFHHISHGFNWYSKNL